MLIGGHIFTLTLLERINNCPLQSCYSGMETYIFQFGREVCPLLYHPTFIDSINYLPSVD